MPLTFLTNQERKLYEQIPMIDEVEMRQHWECIKKCGVIDF